MANDGSNYTANDNTFPTEMYFANGRKVCIAFDGDKPYLTVSDPGARPRESAAVSDVFNKIRLRAQADFGCECVECMEKVKDAK